jgi:hypothetical protein
VYGTPEFWTPLKFPGVQEKLLDTPLVFTLIISGMVEVGDLLKFKVEMLARLAAEILRTFCAPGVRSCWGKAADSAPSRSSS